jgi:L-alanine-DL-glutamate epimerase-like enolase superfamily enzyme
MQLRLHCFHLPLRHTFTIARGSIDVQPTLIVELEEDGLRGYGEATTNDYYGATLESMSAALEAIRPELESHELTDPAVFWEQVRPKLRDNPFAHCALDQAAYDLWGKLRGAPVWKLWGLSIENLPPTNYTIGIDSIESMVAKMQEFPGWPVYKIKLGTDHDVEIVRALRRHTDSVFRVDANCGWTADETISNSHELKELGVEFIEQPLPADQWREMGRVLGASALPVIADESCVTEEDVDRCAGAFHGVNIKLVKCGGMTPARRMIARARELGLSVMVGCMTESTVGISAIAQLLPLLDYVDMDGALLLAKDIATGVSIENGQCRYPRENGNGVRLLGDASRR